MTSSSALAADREFFQSLLTGNVRELETLLADDFMLIDVMQGSEVPRSAFMDLLAGCQLQFEPIVPSGLKVRLTETLPSSPVPRRCESDSMAVPWQYRGCAQPLHARLRLASRGAGDSPRPKALRSPGVERKMLLAGGRATAGGWCDSYRSFRR